MPPRAQLSNRRKSIPRQYGVTSTPRPKEDDEVSYGGAEEQALTRSRDTGTFSTSACFKSSCPSHGCHPEFPLLPPEQHLQQVWAQLQDQKHGHLLLLRLPHPPSLLRQAEILPLKIKPHPLLLLKCLSLLHRLCSLHPPIKKQDSYSLSQLILLLPSMHKVTIQMRLLLWVGLKQVMQWPWECYTNNLLA